jgi:dTDP-glucose 4,6-dehydratase
VLIKKDLDSLLDAGGKFHEFDGATVTILGGTGFIGRWLVQALHEYRLNFGIQSQITVVTRNSKAAHSLFTEELGVAVKIVEFDFTSESIELEKSDFFLNGATPSRKVTGLDDSDAVFTSSVNASTSIIRSSIKHVNKPRVLNLSSGIVYGSQEISVRNQSERPILLQPNSQSGYLNAKLASDQLFSNANSAGLMKSISPKLFAFAGPGIALDEHFAVGNFLRDGINGRSITINSFFLLVKKFFKRIKNKIRTSREFENQGILNRAMNLCHFELLGDANGINEEHKIYEAINPNHIQEIAIQILQI